MFVSPVCSIISRQRTTEGFLLMTPLQDATTVTFINCYY